MEPNSQEKGIWGSGEMKMPIPHFCLVHFIGCSSIPCEQLWLHKLHHDLSYLQSSLRYKTCHRDVWHTAVLYLLQEEMRGAFQPNASWNFLQPSSLGTLLRVSATVK